VLAIALAVLVGCGDDGGGTSNQPAPKAGGGAKPKAKPKAKGKEKAGLKDYPKIEDRVPEIERPTIRHEFRESDFLGDPTGLDNRDPFRSYVVKQGSGLDTGMAAGAPVEKPQCNQRALVASNYNLRDLRLVGIVTRGVRKYALFQDPSDYGHIVNRNDCLGREKAKIKDIGSGFVTLELVPETAANAAPRPPEERSIPLYPNELKLGETDRFSDRRTGGIAPPTMPATGTDPVSPVSPIPPPPPPAPAPSPALP
jgi:hypothetical protein